MKHILRSLAINAFALWLVSQIFPQGIFFAKGTETLVITAAVLGLVNLFIRPLINLFLLPINLLTLGMFRFMVNVITLYLVTLIVHDFKISAFAFPGLTYKGIIIPSVSLNIFWAFVLISFCLSFVSAFLSWLSK